MASNSSRDRSWNFVQLGGSKKTLTLSDWSAPFGRHRQKSVTRKGIQVRHKSTRYPGTNLPPTRHIFGINYMDHELNGRFRDRVLGNGGALAMMEKVSDFVKDGQICDISWGSFMHVTGLISEFDPGIESEHEVEWKMKILIDQDNTQIKQVSPTVKLDPSETVQRALTAVDPITKITKPGGISISINTDIVDNLDSFVSVVTGAFGQLSDIASQISDLESGLASEAKRLIAGVRQAKTALLTLIDALESAQNDSFFIRDSAADTLNYNKTARAAITEANIALALLSDLENQAVSQERGNAVISVRAQQGDTWESISTRVYGSSSEANAIRQANNVRYGSKPKVGSLIVIPLV